MNDPTTETWSSGALLQVARGQRRIIRLILLGLIVGIGLAVFVAPSIRTERDSRDFMTLCRWIGLGFGLVQLYYVLQLATAMRSSVPWLYCLLGFVPVVAVFSLLVLNQNATKVLQANGIRVGFLGANLADFGTETLNNPTFGPDDCGLCGSYLKDTDEMPTCPKCRINVCDSCSKRQRVSAGLVESFLVTCPKCGTELVEGRAKTSGEPAAEEFDDEDT